MKFKKVLPPPITLSSKTSTGAKQAPKSKVGVAIQIRPYPNNLALVAITLTIPDPFWNAGCFVHPNVRCIEFCSYRQQCPEPKWKADCATVNATYLQIFLTVDDNLRSNGRPNINLFPGNKACSNPNNNINLDNQAPADSFNSRTSIYRKHAKQ